MGTSNLLAFPPFAPLLPPSTRGPRADGTFDFLPLADRRVGGWVPKLPPALGAAVKPSVLPALALRMGLVYQDRAKTVLATAGGQFVGCQTCPLTGADFVAPTDAARPVLTSKGRGRWSFVFDGSDDTLVCATCDGVFEYGAAMRLTAATASDSGSVLGNRTDVDTYRYGLFDGGTTEHSQYPYPRAIWRNGVALAQPFDVAPANVPHVYGCQTAGSGRADPLGRSAGSNAGIHFLNLELYGLVDYDADLSGSDQATLWAFLADLI